MPSQDKNLAKLENLVNLLSENVTKEDFTKAFEQVLQVVLKIEQRTNEAVSSLEKTYANLVEQMGKRHDMNYADLKKQVDHVFVADKLTEMKKMMDAKMASVKDGKTPTPEELTSLMKPLIPPPRKGDDGKSITEQDIQKVLKPFTDSLEKRFGELTERITSMPRGRMFGAIGPSVITPRPLRNITPSGTINGSNTDFVLPKSPKKNAEMVYLNGVRMRNGASNDYTIAGRTITFNTAPLTGDIILVDIDF